MTVPSTYGSCSIRKKGSTTTAKGLLEKEKSAKKQSAVTKSRPAKRQAEGGESNDKTWMSAPSKKKRKLTMKRKITSSEFCSDSNDSVEEGQLDARAYGEMKTNLIRLYSEEHSQQGRQEGQEGGLYSDNIQSMHVPGLSNNDTAYSDFEADFS